MKNFLNKIINKETILYIIFGVLTTVVDYLAYYLLRLADVHFIAANVLSWCLAVAFAFITNKIYVFRSRNKTKSALLNELISFVGSRLFSLLASIAFIFTTVTLLGMNDFVSKIISSIFVVIMNYVLSKKYVFTSKDDSVVKKGSFIKENLVYILAFLIPVAILLIIWILRPIYPFGENTYLRSDCYHQYAPFHKELWRKIINGEALTYSWNIGLGSNFTALYAYYLASPFNWIIGLVSESHITEIMNVFILLKIGFSGSIFSYYLSKRYNSKKLNIAAFSVFYALSSYICAFSWNLMWLDCIMLFPLVILGIEKLVKEGKSALYCISLGICILSNYYIAIMICIFSVLYFLLMLIVHSKHTFKYYLDKIVNFGVHSILAGGFASILFIPAFCALSQTASGEFDFPDTLERYFSVMEMLSRSLMTVDAAIFEPHDPNIYCTVAVFILLPLYWFNTKTNIKEKIGKTLLLGILLVSFNLNIPNYIWHGFHFPNSLPCRESFIYIFLILAMCYEGFLFIKEATGKQFFGSYGCSVALILIFEQIFVDDSYDFKIIYLSILFLTFYLFVLMLFRGKTSTKYVLATYLLFVVAFAESFINTETTGFSVTNRTYYLQDNDNIANILEQVKKEDKDFYRIEKYDRRTKNDAAWHGYHGASIFSSTTSAPISELYGLLGFEESCNAYAYYGHTPFTEALLSIKYVLSNNLKDDTSLATLYTSSNDSDSDIYLYKNTYLLPLGFMIDSDINDLIDTATNNPFSVQNSLAYALGAETEMFTRLSVNSVDTDNEVFADEDMHLYVYSTTSLDSIDVNITHQDGTTSSNVFNDMKHKHIIDIGEITAGSTVNVTSGDNEVSHIQIYAYSFHEDVFTTLMDNLNENAFDIKTFNDTLVTGKINADNDGFMFTSIPYDKGWSVYVDGEKVEAETFLDAFIMIPVSEGKHTIEFMYAPDGLYTGMFLSIISVLTFIAILVCRKKIDSKQKSATLDTTK